MLDLGTSFLAAVERDPDKVAIVDGARRLTYAQWHGPVAAAVAFLRDHGVGPGDAVATILTNRFEAATLHWACQLLGATIVPFNWRATGEELLYVLQDSGPKLLFCEEVSRTAATDAGGCAGVPVVDFDAVEADPFAPSGAAGDVMPMAEGSTLSVMLYTSGTTGRPKGVPRRHGPERAAAIAHIAQNTYRFGERTLGVMPLYHTMGVRLLLSMGLSGGRFVCLPRFDPARAISLIREEAITCLYLVPTLFHDLIEHPGLSPEAVGSVETIGFAGAPMTPGLMARIDAAFQPRLFVNHYGSSEIYSFTIDQNARLKPGSAGRAALNQRIRVVEIGARDPAATVAPDVEGEIVADLAGDEAFEGYWNRPDADEKALVAGWYFTGDTGYFDADGDLFVTGRVDDMIISGGENISPAEIENCLSLHPAVKEIAVVGLPDPRWGQIVAAFVVPAEKVDEATLDSYCRNSGLAAFKRPRAYAFVDGLPKSPVGKLLRRILIQSDTAKALWPRPIPSDSAPTDQETDA